MEWLVHAFVLEMHEAIRHNSGLFFISLVYERYAGSIRKEYSHIPHDDYCQRRAKVLHMYMHLLMVVCIPLGFERFPEGS